MSSGRSSGQLPSQASSAAEMVARNALAGMPGMARYTGISPPSCSMVGLTSCSTPFFHSALPYSSNSRPLGSCFFSHGWLYQTTATTSLPSVTNALVISSRFARCSRTSPLTCTRTAAGTPACSAPSGVTSVRSR